MTIEQIFKKAIEGGWKPNHLGRVIAKTPTGAVCSESYLLELSFWQALGKAMRWSWRTECCNIWSKEKPPEEYHHHTWGMGKWTEEWLYHATCYFKDYAMQGRSAEEYFGEL